MRGVAQLLALAALLCSGTASAVEPPSPGSPSPTTVALPGAPGSVQGLTAAGQVSGFTGQYSYSLPVDLPPGRAGFKLSMSLSYNGALGNGYMGIGWGFSAPHIKRSTRLGPPTYTEADELELAGIGGGGRLIYIESGPYQGEYRVEGQGQSVRVVLIPADTEDPNAIDTFKVTTSDGTIYTLDEPETCPEDGERPHGVYAWYVTKVAQLPQLPRVNEDDEGETGIFEYDEQGGHRRLKSIRWTSLGGAPESYAYQAVFAYETRRDRVLSYRAGFRQSIDSRLTSITVWSFGNVRRIYELAYDDLHLTRLHQITVKGADGLALPPVTFTYGGEIATPAATQAEGTGGWRLNQRGVTLHDVDGDGLSDLARFTEDQRLWRKNLGGAFTDAEPLYGGANVHLDDIRLMDLDGDLMAEMVYVVNDTWRVYRLEGDTFVGGEIWPGTTTVPLAAPDTIFADINGDSRTDVLRATFSGTTLAMGGDIALGGPVKKGYLSDGDAHLDPGDTNVQLHDVNGDGLVDVVWLADPYLKVYWGRGDGTFVTTTQQYCYPWNWKAGKNDANPGAYGCDEQHPEVFDLRNLRLADLDRDGLLDLVRISAGKVYFYPGYWSEAADVDELSPFGEPVVLPRPAGAEYDDVVTIADLNGNGSADVVWSTAWGLWIMDLSGSATKAMLVAIDNGMGAKTLVDYTTSSLSAIAAELAGSPWNERLPTTQAMPVQVTSEVPEDPTQPTIVTTYVSRDGFWDATERIFGGYLEVSETQWGEDDNDTLVTTTRFLRGDGSERVLRGSPYFVQRADGAGKVFDETTTSRNVISVTDLPATTSNPLLGVVVTLEETTTVEECDCGNGKTLRTTYDHDGYGNIIKESKLGDVAVSGDEITTEREYLSSFDDWVLFKECQSKAYTASDFVYESRTLTVFEPSVSPSGGDCVGDVGDGRVRAVYGALCNIDTPVSCGSPSLDLYAGDWVRSSETTYDTWGNPTSVWEKGVTRSLTYDADSIVPLAEGVDCTPIDIEITSYNYTLGLPEAVLDANGDLAAVTFDSLGRVIDTWHDYDENGTVNHTGSFSYDLSGPRPSITATTDESDVLRDTVTKQVFAASGAPLYSATETDAGWLINGHRERNVRGLTVRVANAYGPEALPDDDASFPTSGPGARPHQTIAYDALGRAVEQHLPEVPGAPAGGAVHTIAYAPLATTAQSSGLAAVVTTSNGLGHVTHVRRDIPGPGQTVTTEEVNAYWTLYGLGGYVLQPNDPVPVTKYFSYDTLGRVVLDSDPDSGYREYYWTDEGWLDAISTLQGTSQTFDYDCAGRLVSRYGYPPGETWTFTYDSDDASGSLTVGEANNQIGRLAMVEGPGSYLEGYIYDAAGRVASRSRSVPSGSGGSGVETIRVGMTYSPTGKVLAQQLFDGSDDARIRVEMDYDEAARLRWIGYAIDDNSTLPLYELLDLKASGAPLIERYGNGIGTRFVRDDLDQVTALDVVDVSGGPTWNPATHGPTAPSTFAVDLTTYDGGFDTTSAADIRYQVGIERNAWGGVTAVHDSAHAPQNPRRDAVFGYDEAMRLLSAEVGETFDDNTSLGSWSFSYAHDGLQNLTKREIDDTPFGADMPVMAHGTHTHGGSGAGPRQLTSVASGETFTYDAVGRMVTRARPSLPTQTLTWDGFDRLRSVADASAGEFVEHLYGPDGERMWSGWYTTSSGPQVREHYLFGGGVELRDERYELVVSGGGSRSLARIRVNQSGSSDPEVVYMHPGVGPGPVTLTDAFGAVVEERLFEPFGTALVDTADFDIEPTGWNAKPVDPWTTWSDHGARWLGTDFGHWLSPDPLASSPSAVQVAEFWRMSPFAPVGGNPVTYWDPDGNNFAVAARAVDSAWRAVAPTVQAIGARLTSAAEFVGRHVARIVTLKSAMDSAADSTAASQTSAAASQATAQDWDYGDDEALEQAKFNAYEMPKLMGRTAGAAIDGGLVHVAKSGARDASIGQKIAEGHAGEHAGELGVDSKEDLAELVDGIVLNPDAVKTHPKIKGKTAYWSDDGIIVIDDPTTEDGGTVFSPDRGKEYFDDLWKR